MVKTRGNTSVRHQCSFILFEMQIHNFGRAKVEICLHYLTLLVLLWNHPVNLFTSLHFFSEKFFSLVKHRHENTVPILSFIMLYGSAAIHMFPVNSA